jgi:cell division protein FtsB
LLATMIVGGMKVGAADEKIRQLEAENEKQERQIEAQQKALNEQTQRTIRIEEQTKGIKDSTVRIEALIQQFAR